MPRQGIFIYWVLLLAHAAAATEIWPPRIEVGAGYHYSTGDYGGSEDTEIMYAPVTAKAELGSWTARLTVPYLRISGGEALVEGPTGPLLTSGGAAEGLGDIFLDGSYTIAPLNWWMPFIDIGGRLKFPTADEDKGLGTGEFDFSPEATAARRYGPFTPFLSLGYRFLGDLPQASVGDGFIASGGVLYRLLEPLDGGLFLAWREASSDFSDDALDLIPFISWRISNRWITDVYASAGLTDGSPDVGSGLQIRYRHEPAPAVSPVP